MNFSLLPDAPPFPLRCTTENSLLPSHSFRSSKFHRAHHADSPQFQEDKSSARGRTSTMSTVIVTGASRGLGYAITEFLLQASANVIAIARDCNSLEPLVATFPGSLKYVAGDVCDPNTIQVALQLALEQYGRLDSVVFNAGVLEPVSKIANCDVNTWKQLFDINFFSIVASLPVVLPALRESQGRIIMISSGAATKSYQAWSAYGCSKAAMNHLVQDLGMEEKDVTSVSVKPGVVDTDMQRSVREQHAIFMDPEQAQKFTGLYDRGELKQAHDVAQVIGRLTLQAEKEFSGKSIDWEDYDKKYVPHKIDPSLSEADQDRLNGLLTDSEVAALMSGAMTQMPMVFPMQPTPTQSSRKRAKNSNADDGRHLFGCEVCGERFTRHENLKRHQRNHDDSAIEHCPKCEVTCRRHDLLKRHVKKFHPADFDTIFPPKVPGQQPVKQEEQRMLAATDAAQTLTSLATPIPEGMISMEGIGEGQSLSAAIHPHLQYDPSQSLHQYRGNDANSTA